MRQAGPPADTQLHRKQSHPSGSLSPCVKRTTVIEESFQLQIVTTRGVEHKSVGRNQRCCCCCVITKLCWVFATPWTAACQAPVSTDSPGKKTGVGCLALLQGIFLTQGWNLHLLHWQVDSLLLRHQGSPKLALTTIKWNRLERVGNASPRYLLKNGAFRGFFVSSIFFCGSESS